MYSLRLFYLSTEWVSEKVVSYTTMSLYVPPTVVKCALADMITSRGLKNVVGRQALLTDLV